MINSELETNYRNDEESVKQESVLDSVEELVDTLVNNKAEEKLVKEVRIAEKNQSCGEELEVQV